jgi:prepilin-type processing-associated H-X9-DG protein
MDKNNRFAGSDIFAAVICAALLLANLGLIGSTGRERAKRAVCLANLSRLTMAWHAFADDNDDRIINGDPEEYSADYLPGGTHYGETPWVRRDWTFHMPLEDKIQAIKDGALFHYAGDVKLYTCPRGLAGTPRTCAVVDAMNCKSWPNIDAVMLKTRSQIKHPAERFVFVDGGPALSVFLGGWTQYTDRENWWDPPPVHHNAGANFSFADGHGEYWKWTDPRTLAAAAEPFSNPQPGNQDLRRVQIACWGREIAKRWDYE